jgi:hypothetical protein
MTEAVPCPAKARPLLSVVTTTDPETRCLSRLIEALAYLKDHHDWEQEIIIVDDLKQWADWQEARAFAATHNRTGTTVTPLWYPEHRGQMAALHAGLYASSGQAILTLDPDLYASVATIPDMLDQWRSGCLLVHGRRRERRHLGPVRRVGTSVTNALVRQITALPVHDLGSPATLFCASMKPILDTMPAGIGNARLYAYSLYRDRLCEVTINAEPAEVRKSHYRLATLVPVFLSLIFQAWRVRRVT